MDRIDEPDCFAMLFWFVYTIIFLIEETVYTASTTSIPCYLIHEIVTLFTGIRGENGVYMGNSRIYIICAVYYLFGGAALRTLIKRWVKIL